MARHKKTPDEMSLAELHSEAALQGIEGRSGMNKEQLIAALKGTSVPPSSHAPARTTVGGQTPEETDEPATLEDGTPKGAAHYPPSPSDSAGEKTDNIAPSKRLPPDVPASEGGPGGDELTRLKAENTALAQVVRNLGGNPEEVAKQATAGLLKERTAAAGPTRTATVTPVGGSPMQVAFPADAKDPHAAAVEAYKTAAGVWSLPTQPHVELDGNGEK